MSFKRDLEIGLQGEKIVRAKLEQLGYKTKDGDGRAIDFLLVNGKAEYSCEAKLDLYASKSQNLAIETFNPKSQKPSGLASTKCDYWFHALSVDEIYFSKTKDLKKFVRNNKPFREVSGAGDGNAFILLYKKEKICGKGLVELNKGNVKKCFSKSN